MGTYRLVVSLIHPPFLQQNTNHYDLISGQIRREVVSGDFCMLALRDTSCGQCATVMSFLFATGRRIRTVTNVLLPPDADSRTSSLSASTNQESTHKGQNGRGKEEGLRKS